MLWLHTVHLYSSSHFDAFILNHSSILLLLSLFVVGPSQWKDLDGFDDNQCGGNGQVDGFGQSPIIIPIQYSGLFGSSTCYDDMSGYTWAPGNCRYRYMKYKVRKDGLSFLPKPDMDGEPVCHLGRFQNNKTKPGVWYEATEIRFKLGSEHAYEVFTPASMEMQGKIRIS